MANGILGLLGTLLLAICPLSWVLGTSIEEPFEPPVIESQVSGNTVIFTAEQSATMYLEPVIGVDTAEYWTPSALDVESLELGLPLYMQQYADRFFTEPPAWERLDEYYRQYVGYYNENGERVMYGNFFCSPMEFWDQYIVMVADGGDCFFQVQYNVDTGTFLQLMVNGEA